MLLFVTTLGDAQSVFLVCPAGLSHCHQFAKSLRFPCLVFVLGFSGLNVRQLDRHNNYYQLDGFYFPHHEDPRLPLKNSLVDGELVVDVDPQTQRASQPYLPFQ